MGNLASRVFKRLSGVKESKIFLGGLDAAGKTTILYTLSMGKDYPPDTVTIPTIGFNVEKVRVGKVEFTIWDSGYRAYTNNLVRYYYQNC